MNDRDTPDRPSGRPMAAALAAILSLGVAVLPKVALTLPGPAVRGVRLVAPRLTRIVALARNTTRYESPAARTFAEFLRARLRP